MLTAAITEELEGCSMQRRHHPKRRSSSPGQGMSLEAITAAKGRPLREAISTMASGLNYSQLGDDFRMVFAPRYCGCAVPEISPDRVANRAAWNLACVWLLCRHATGEKRGIVEAEEWFRGATSIPAPLFGDALPSKTRWVVEQHLSALSIDADFWDLLPYLLEEQGAGSRASVIRDPGTAEARQTKKKNGVFYTPSDVAEYMVRRCLEGANEIAHDRLCLDPAAGTGVFLLALLHVANSHGHPDFNCFDYASDCLHGLDVSGHALDACAFVLLRACWHDVERRGLSPWSAWHRLRMNFVQADALTVQLRASPEGQAETKMRFSAIVEALTETHPVFVEPEAAQSVKASNPLGPLGGDGVILGSLFPMAERGFNVLVGNPPYASIGQRQDIALLVNSFSSLPESTDISRANLFPLFIEMMWRFTSPASAVAALVTPLSIAYHNGRQYVNCRRAMSASGGRWQFAFFDREPHALFGEEVKTRNAILFRSENAQTPARGNLAEIETGPLRKWTSRTRHALFESISFTALGSSIITHGIPKLGGETQATAFCGLQRATTRLLAWCQAAGTCRPGDAIGMQDRPRVFIGGTAYNFLNVYRWGELVEGDESFPLSESSVHCLEFHSEQDAEAAFAILSSRLTFWLWHVMCDGFHVPGWLWQEIPFSRASFDSIYFGKIAALGRALWLRLREHRFTSVNGGKLTIGYRPLHCREERDAIDAVLVEAAGLPGDFIGELRSFVQYNTVVDATDKRRQHLNLYFPTTSQA